MRWSNLASGRFMPRDAFPRKRGKGDIDHWPGFISGPAGTHTRQSFLRRYNLTYECILELF